MKRTIHMPEQLFRSGTSTLDKATNTIRLSIASDEPYMRMDWNTGQQYLEVLDHSPAGIDTARLKAGTPLLYNHDRNILLGRNTYVGSDGKKSYVEATLSDAEDVRSYRTKIAEGILVDSSVGYTITGEGEEVGQRDGVPILKFRWMPYEASLVTVPADQSVGVGRAQEKTETRIRAVEVELSKSVDETTNAVKAAQPPNTMSEPTTAPAPATQPAIDIVKERQDALTEFKQRCKKIDEFVGALKNPSWREAAQAIATKHKEGNAEFDAFRAEALNSFHDVTPITTPSPTIGMSQKEKNRFSLLRAIRTLANKQPLEGLEREVSDAAAKLARMSVRPDAVYLPEDINSHDIRDNPEFSERAFAQFVRTNQNVSTASAGGFTVATMLGSLIELLRNKTVLGQVGVTTLSGLQGDIAFPVQTGGATAAWVAESGALSDSAATFGQKVMTPNRLGATIPFTTQFLEQSSLSAEQFVRSELMTATGIALDLAGLEGTGADGQPLGVKNTSGINATVTFGGTATWADVVEFETGITADNADIGSMAFILSSATVGKWKTVLKDAVAGADYLINSLNGTANGYPVHRTNQVTGNIAFFGCWSQLLHAMWGTTSVIVDPYALKKSGGIEVTMNSLHDFLVRQPLAFNVSTDTAAA